MNTIPKLLLIICGVWFVVLLLLVSSVSVSSGGVVYTSNGKVRINQGPKNADVTGGLATTAITNYAFLAENYSGYTYADAIQKYLSSYWQQTYKAPVDSATVDEQSLKNESESVSTFKVNYDGKVMVVRVTNVDGVIFGLDVIEDAGNKTSFSTGQLDIIATE